MAEERNTGLTTNSGGTAPTRASEANTSETVTVDTEETKEDLQRRMDEARESISQTVSEIKDTVTTQYNTVRETINDSLDWREQFRRRPVPFSLGALGVGLLVGYSLGGVFKGGSDDYYDYDEDETSYEYDDTDYSDDYTPTMAARGVRKVSSPAVTASSYSYDDSSADAEANEPAGPGIFERFKGTQAYDKLTNEVGTIGNRLVDELSHTAQAVVLPMLLGKVKDLIGIDLGTQRQVAERSKLEQQSSSAQSEAVKAEGKQQTEHAKKQENAASTTS
ncbi:MAG: hypothetical protein MSG64_08215 [Pyrinomonadaceae bacterium MAG19_C2-C3]|nr:hypothetical protein [Pyrinomonadaceae bacterium MAG19_C2-C3]